VDFSDYLHFTFAFHNFLCNLDAADSLMQSESVMMNTQDTGNTAG